jgi:hypothetical protein
MEMSKVKTQILTLRAVIDWVLGLWPRYIINDCNP